MTNVLANPFRATGLGLECPFPHDDASGVADLLHHCPAHAPTPLLDLTDLAAEVHVDRIRVKDERSRMGLGSFKALGAAHAIARDAADKVDGPAAPVAQWNTALNGRTYVTASAGNHGLSVAAGTAVFG
ncbi:pyridoxal-phosphate dependent enzyme, partial [Tritonibacter horizontis]|uniref:pyridoxal-phosphate dependent enzyme n=1 Tax=Tritonibacter horizontis TaxID=1768241 RepID=UPI0010421841